MQKQVTEDLADFATAPVHPTGLALGMARLSMLDWLVCGRSGVTEPVSQILRDQAEREAGTPSATMFGGGAVPARMAALVNGTISHALDYDDTHFAHIGHPSVGVFPAAFAIGQELKAGLAEILEAGLVGMELSIRIGLWLGRSHYQAGFHQTATAGTFGAAASAGRLMGLSKQQMAMAFGLGATRAAGLKAQFGTMGKPYNAGLAAAGGVEVAQLVAAGFEANPEALEGPLGFRDTHHGEGDSNSAMEGLGETWQFEGISHKFHACCHGLHASLEAARELDLAAPEIAELRVKTHPRWMSVCNQTAPTTGLGAKFSYRTVLAMQALGRDTARLDSYSDAIASDAKVSELRRRIHVEADENLSETAATVELLRKDGQRFSANHDLLAPMTLDEREQRVLRKAGAMVGEQTARELWGMLQNDLSAEDCGLLISTG